MLSVCQSEFSGIWAAFRQLALLSCFVLVVRVDTNCTVGDLPLESRTTSVSLYNFERIFISQVSHEDMPLREGDESLGL